MFYVFSFPAGVYVGTLNLIASIPDPSILTSCISYTSPYLEFQVSLFKIKTFFLCLIILPILKSKSPYLASQMDHMYFMHFMKSSVAESFGNAYV